MKYINIEPGTSLTDLYQEMVKAKQMIHHEERNVLFTWEFKGDGGYQYPFIEYDCIDHDQQWVKFKRENGTLTLRKQCFSCGQLSSDFKKSCVENFDSLPFFMPEIRSFIYDYKNNLSRELGTIKNDEAWDEYMDYLKSDKWLNKRSLVLKRDNYLCQACLENKAFQVHHLTYENIYDEPMFDLISVCVPCHEKIETKKKKQ